jgi:membrane protease subunit HflK
MSPDNKNDDGPWGSSSKKNEDETKINNDGKSPWDRRNDEGKPSLKREGRDPWAEKDRRGKKHSSEYDDLDEILNQSKDKFQKLFGKGGDNGQKKGGSGNASFWGVLFFVFFVWLLTGVYVVDSAEQGVVLRFGEFKKVTGSGINYHLPYPIEVVYKVNVDTVRQEDIGYRKGVNTISKSRVFSKNSLGNNKGTIANIVSANSSNVPEESIMLTGDENIVDIDFNVQWLIKDATDYLFNMKDPAGTVRVAAESSMREVIGQTPIQEVLANDKKEIQRKVQNVLQESLDNFGAGILIEAVNLQKVDPPEEVIEAFNDVQNAKADKQRIENEAEAYSNDILPKARGLATRKKQEAEAYKSKVVNAATGEAERFLAVYSEYKEAKEVTAKRLYLEAMEEILRGTEKVIIDNKGGAGVLPYLPLKSLGGAK